MFLFFASKIVVGFLSEIGRLADRKWLFWICLENDFNFIGLYKGAKMIHTDNYSTPFPIS